MMIDNISKFLRKHNKIFTTEAGMLRCSNIIITYDNKKYYYLNGVCVDDINFVYYVLLDYNDNMSIYKFTGYMVDMQRKYNRLVKIKAILV
jgi:hypothetical protein